MINNAKAKMKAMPKRGFPKTLGDCVDRLGELDDEITGHSAQLKTAKDAYNILEQHMFELLGAQKTTTAKGKTFSAESKIHLLPTVEDWAKYRKYIVQNQAWELLQKRPGVEAWRERLAQKIIVPGSTVFKKVVLNLSRIRTRGR